MEKEWEIEGKILYFAQIKTAHVDVIFFCFQIFRKKLSPIFSRVFFFSTNGHDSMKIQFGLWSSREIFEGQGGFF